MAFTTSQDWASIVIHVKFQNIISITDKDIQLYRNNSSLCYAGFQNLNNQYIWLHSNWIN